MSAWEDEDDFGEGMDPDGDDYHHSDDGGFCRECEMWGDIQCRVHGDVVIEQMRQEHEIYWIGVMARRGKRTKAGRKARFRLYQQRGGR